jgi:SAM-dependent methyltransferase
VEDADRLDWIFESDGDLADRYDRWAGTYDDDHDSWGWQGPERAVETLGSTDIAGPILDAGCGTGRVGAVLRQSGFDGLLVGLDFSGGMLSQARERGYYDLLVQGSLFDLPMRSSAVGAVISTGVFTHAHVGGEAFAGLVEVCRPGAPILITMRDDIAPELLPHADVLTAASLWSDRTPPIAMRLHPTRDDSTQTLRSWTVH